MDYGSRSQIIAAKREKLGKLPIATLEGFSLVEVERILYMESDNTYTLIFMENGEKIVSTRNLGAFEQELIREPFLRIHNSFIVNLTKITKYVKADDGYVILCNGKPIKVSRSKRDDLLIFFQSIR